MEQIRKLLAHLSVRQRISILAAVIAVAAALAGASRVKKERDYRPLFTGLSAEDAGAVTARLREAGVEYRLGADGATILAPSAKIPELRIRMAAAGLPRSGRAGFELFDRTNFGATEFSEQVNYRRAIEGELERSVMSLAEVEQARVHVTFAKDSLFVEAREPAKASVMLKLRPAMVLPPQHVLAICHLVSSAVEGLRPEAVSVLDMRGNLLNRGRNASDPEQPSEAVIEFRRQMEKDLLAKVSATLEPLLGAEGFRAGVSVECDFTSGEQSEESFDPNRSVMASSQTTEDISGAAPASGIPGTPSSLPRPAARPAAPGTGTGTTRRTENITYQSSRTVRRTRLPQGTLKRMSIAVLVDQEVGWEGTGAAAKRTLTPPSPERLKTIRDVVAAATGFTAERGDQLVVETLPFDSTMHREPPPAPSAPAARPAPPPATPKWLMGAIALGAISLLAAAAFGVLMVRRRRRRLLMEEAAAVGPGAGVAALERGRGDRMLEAPPAVVEMAAGAPSKAEALVKELAESAARDPLAAAQILRTWLLDPEANR